jgi:hypothetical protein
MAVLYCWKVGEPLNGGLSSKGKETDTGKHLNIKKLYPDICGYYLKYVRKKNPFYKSDRMIDILSKKLNFPCWYPSVTGKIHVAWYKNIKLFYRKLNTSNILILLLLMLPLRQMALSDGMQ